MTATGYSGQQINLKRPDGTLINITGADMPALVQNVEDFIEHAAPLLDRLLESIQAQALVGNALGGTPLPQEQVAQAAYATQPAQSKPAPPAPAAPGPSTETDRWGNSFELGHPEAPLTPHGPAVLKRGKSQSGNLYAQWVDPRAKAVPSNYARGVRQDPPDVWPAEFARRGI